MLGKLTVVSVLLLCSVLTSRTSSRRIRGTWDMLSVNRLLMLRSVISGLDEAKLVEYPCGPRMGYESQHRWNLLGAARLRCPGGHEDRGRAKIRAAYRGFSPLPGSAPKKKIF
ncbi:hypothetical protein GQ600_3870 [Phytophthora cactorum]|nr:hypothetical protein GQ600_3870 [Phytophthora cactorum]